MNMSSSPSPAELEKRARRRAGAKMGWYIHAFVYVLVNLGLVVLSDSKGHTWAVYPLMGWGLGLLVHGAVIWFIAPGGDFYERLVERVGVVEDDDERRRPALRPHGGDERQSQRRDENRGDETADGVEAVRAHSAGGDSGQANASRPRPGVPPMGTSRELRARGSPSRPYSATSTPFQKATWSRISAAASFGSR